ncbi:hypothetical protein ACFL5T_01450 [Gemmatimonadota bacterium]
MGFSISKRVAACSGALILTVGACGEEDNSALNPGPLGDFAVITVSSGDELDLNGYVIRVDDISSAGIGANDSVEFQARAVGTYTVELTEVAANCSVNGDNPRSVQVIADSLTNTTFEVTCVPTAGGLRVLTATSGENPDDGYTLAVDSLDAGVIGANDTASTADLQTGEHTVRLGDIALNCHPVGDPERVVLVPSEGFGETTFEVVCTDRVGNLRLVTSTTGLFPDSDGYDIVIEFGGPIPIGSTAVRTVGAIAGGVTRVHLLESTVADNCSVLGENPRSVNVPSGGLVDTVFDVTCGAR